MLASDDPEWSLRNHRVSRGAFALDVGPASRTNIHKHANGRDGSRCGMGIASRVGDVPRSVAAKPSWPNGSSAVAGICAGSDRCNGN